ncbi:MAG: choice-of-anchor V domain-containing protein [Bacteroidia bacterium]
MKSKFTLSLLVVLVCTLILNLYNNTLHSNGGGAPAGKTGSPGDNSDCTSCHITSGTPVNGAILITSNVPTGGYISGNTYQITVRAAHATFNKFGFQASPQSASGTLLGTLATTNNTETQLVGSGKYITHKSAGTAGTSIPSVGNFKEWSFNWTAPSAGTGNVTFYAAAILANANNQNSGDSLVKGTLVINESATNGIQSINATNKTFIYPNPAYNFLNINAFENVDIMLFNMGGKMIFQQNINAGLNNIDISNLPSGIYFVKVHGKSTSEILKFVKQ